MDGLSPLAHNETQKMPRIGPFRKSNGFKVVAVVSTEYDLTQAQAQPRPSSDHSSNASPVKPFLESLIFFGLYGDIFKSNFLLNLYVDGYNFALLN